MEAFSGLDPDAILKIPLTRRHRLLLKKVDTERERANRIKSQRK